MIPDEDEPSEVDIYWFLTIAMTRLGFSKTEAGRLTVITFNKFYQRYKDTFDLEMRLKNANVTYEEALKKAQRQEEWL